MTLKEIESRIVRLERDPTHSRLARMSEAEIEDEALAALTTLIGSDGSFAAVIAEMEASDEPEIRKGAKLTAQHFGARYSYIAPASATP